MRTRGRHFSPFPRPLGTSTAPMTARTWPAYCFGFMLTSELFVWHVTGLQCYACNVGSTRKTIDVGCFHPEVITCSQSHKGFKHRFCIKTENTASGIALTSGCATSRHCQQQELPGMRIYCCDSDLCNGAPYRRGGTLHCLCTVLSLLLLWLQQ